MKIVCYMVSKKEAEFFTELNSYGFELKLIKEIFSKNTRDEASGFDAILVHGSCQVNKENIEYIYHKFNIKYIFTRSAGFNHIDIDTCSKLGIKVATTSGYSPNAVGELTLGLAMNLLRNITYATDRISRQLNMMSDGRMYSRELRNCTVGIIGTGNIGQVTGKLFKGLGAKVIGYSRSKIGQKDDTFDYLDLDSLLEQSDIVTIHIPYDPGKNDGFINIKLLEKMKKGSILINASRGNLQVNADIAMFLESGHLYGFATDVIPDEANYFGKNFNSIDDIKDSGLKALINLYPRALFTPHIGAMTDQATKEMVAISLENFDDIFNGRTPKNLIV